MFCNILDVDEWPGAEVAVANGFEPCCLDRVAGCRMEITNGGFDAGEFINIV
jgi:hypothetical protein